MSPEQFKQIMIQNGMAPIGNALWARQALIGASLDARDLFFESNELSEVQWESFCDEIVDAWPDQ